MVDCLYSAELPANLLNVSALSKRGCKVQLTNDYAHITMIMILS